MKKLLLLSLLFPAIIFAQKNSNQKRQVLKKAVPQTVAINLIPARVNEKPLLTWLYNTNNMTIVRRDAPQREVGFAFQSTKKGVIYGLSMRMPFPGNNYTISFWDDASKQLIKQKTFINFYSAGFTSLDISSTNDEFTIEANKTYVISVNTAPLSPDTLARPFYQLTGYNSADFLPITQGHIKILEGRYSLNEAPKPVFPDQKNLLVVQALYGLVDILFYATER